MTTRLKTMLVGVAVAALLLAATAAHAGRLSYTNSLGTTAWRATWNQMTYTGGFGTVNCTLTLEGSLHSNTFAKVRGSLVGYVTGGRTSGCTSFGATVLTANLPWHVRYNLFAGTLPNISSIALQVIGFEFLIRESFFGAECLLRSTEAAPLSMIWNRTGGTGAVTSAALNGTITTDCGITGTIGGTSNTFTPSASIALI